MNQIFEQEILIRVDEVDLYNKLKIESLLKYFQEIATLHSEVLGNGRKDLAPWNAIWVLSRISVQMDSYPSYGEVIKIKSWPAKTRKFMFPRQFEVFNQKNEKIGQATSIWCLVDMEKRNIILNPTFVQFPEFHEIPFSMEASKVIIEKPLENVVTHSIWYSDLDINRHVNNVTYLKWAFDLIGVPFLQEHETKRIDVNFLNEISLFDQVDLAYDNSEQCFMMEGKKDLIHFTMKIEWRKTR